jgi:hypothetical protein
VPEAAVEEDDQAPALPNQVTARPGGRTQADVDAVADAAGVQPATDRELVRGVAARLPAEAPGDRL